MRLPDGTIVFLNAESSLKYPVSFVEKGKRQVFLTGEGYFEVAKDRSHPFIVKTTRQEVQVLGTHFNINSYDDEAATTTTLLEGSVLVSNSNLVQKVLRPGEQSVLSSGRIQVAPADVEEAIDWKNGEFIFGGDNFRTVMRKIERWYNIEVIYEPSAPINLQLGGFSSRSRNISTVLKMIAKTGEVHFRIEGRKVFVSK
ncbi:FecR family protein [Pedobacter sp. P26]|uniref:FecR family protein n=1 Tax=Pedobacter sp. P26 TaxID=3423956 RepID=UPI003D672BB1